MTEKLASLPKIALVAIVGIGGFIIMCYLCFIVLAIIPSNKTPAQKAETTSSVSPSATTQEELVSTETPLPENATEPIATSDSHPTGLIVDASKLIGATRPKIELILGKSVNTETMSPGDIDDMPNGGEVRTYQVGIYSVEVDFDSKFNATGFQVTKGLAEENWSLDDWSTLLSRFGLSVSVAPDVSNDKNYIWHNVNGDGILIASETRGGQVWTVRIFLCKYSSTFSCTP